MLWLSGEDSVQKGATDFRGARQRNICRFIPGKRTKALAFSGNYLLNGAGDGREYIVRAGADKPNRTYSDRQDHG